MKKRLILFILILLATLAPKHQMYAATMAFPSSTSIVAKPCVVPVLVAIGEGVAAIAGYATVTTETAAGVGLLTTSAGITVVYFVTRPAPNVSYDFDLRIEFDELVPVENTPPDHEPQPDPGKKPFRPNLQPEEKFLLLVNLAELAIKVG